MRRHLFEPAPRPLPDWLKELLGQYCPEVDLSQELYHPYYIGVLTDKAKAARGAFQRHERCQTIEYLGLVPGMVCEQGVISSISDGWVFFYGHSSGRWHPKNVILKEK